MFVELAHAGVEREHPVRQNRDFDVTALSALPLRISVGVGDGQFLGGEKGDDAAAVIGHHD
ncbi:MAG: hypothetical protein V3T62_04870, partial [Alphaproteobacteria bacterium]